MSRKFVKFTKNSSKLGINLLLCYEDLKIFLFWGIFGLMNSSTKKIMLGFLYAGLASFIYGLSSVLAKLSYAEGSNSFMYVFLRSALALIPFAIFVYHRYGSFRITKEEFRASVLLGVMGTGMATLLVFTSFNYLPVGIGIVVHYSYPLMVMLVSIIVYKTRFAKFSLVLMLIAAFGFSTFWEGGDTASYFGLFLAFASSISYAFYIMYLERSVLRYVNPHLVAFYLTLIMTVFGLVMALAFGQFTLDLTPKGWVYSFILAFSITFFCYSYSQKSIALIGAPLMSIICLIEPLTGVLFSLFLLGEQISTIKIIGIVVILVSIGLLYGYEIYLAKKR